MPSLGGVSARLLLYTLMGDLTTDTLLWYGDAVKLIEQDEKQAKVGGYLVRFRADENDEDVDLYGDYFTPDTDFGEAKSSPILFEHGFDSKLGKKRIGRGEIKTDDVGVWIEGYLDKRSQYEEAVLQMVEDGKLGWSSGTAAHLVEYEHTKTGNRILSWPLGLDASLTFTPAEYRNKAIPLKSVYSDRAEAVEETAQVKEIVEQETINQHIEMEQTQPTPQENQEPMVKGFSEADMQEAVKSALAQYQEGVQKTVTKTAEAPKTFNVNSTYTKGWQKSEESITAHYIRTGSRDAVKLMNEIKASNDTSGNITTSADGSYAVPTGQYQDIIARRDLSSLVPKLGITRIPGKGTTVNVPYDNGAANVMVSTSEEGAADRDLYVLGQKAFTLVKYTKKIALTGELLEDEDSNLLNFVNDYVARAVANTENTLIITEAGANGTDLGSFAGSAAIAVDELDAIPYGNTIAKYHEMGRSAWVMAPATYGAIIKLDDANDRRYAPNAQGTNADPTMPNLLGYPVHFCTQVSAIGGGNKSVFFGNWSYLGMYTSNGLTFRRNEFNDMDTDIVNLYFRYRVDFGVLNPEALGYIDHPTA